MNYIPPRPSGSSRFARFVQAVWDLFWGTESIFVSTPQGPLRFEKLANGKYNPILKPSLGGGGTEGWHWANPKEYNPATAYAINEAVIVSPTNTANTAGINNGIDPAVGGAIVGADGFGPNADRAMAGTWLCVKPPKILDLTGQPADDEAPRNYHVHVPIWTLPNIDPDHADNYWMLIGLYPVILNVCINGVDIPHYVQGQPVPDEFLLGEGGEAMTGEGGEGITAEQ